MGGFSMRLRQAVLSICIFFITNSFQLQAQITSYPHFENFDGVAAPGVPIGWSANGFVTYASSPHSSPNCVSVTGNRTMKMLMSPVFDFSGRLPDRLIFWERRTTSAGAYRLEVNVSTNGIDFGTVLVCLDTIPLINTYVQRIVDLSTGGLQNQSNVQFRWMVLADSTNNTGVVRLDDITITVAVAHDIGLLQMSITPVNGTRMDPLSISVLAKNNGIRTASNFSIQFYSDDNFNGIGEHCEEISLIHIPMMNSGDSLISSVTLPALNAGEHYFIARADLPQDENHKNDTAYSMMTIGNIHGDLLVNEIMYAPAGDEPEWVELYNASPDIINLKNWRISDNIVVTKSVVTSSDALLSPNSFIVIAKDSMFSVLHSGIPCIMTSFSALNNITQDAVVVYDPQLKTIDSMSYQPSWGGHEGKSLERIDLNLFSTSSENWKTSEDAFGCTPGRINSIARLEYDIELCPLTQKKAVIAEKIMPMLEATIRNIGKKDVDTLLLQFFGDCNRNGLMETSELICTKNIMQKIISGDSILISELFPQLNSGETNIIVNLDWWRDERVRNNSTSILVRMCYEPQSLIINEIMFNPLDGQNEWIELFNRSDQPVDLASWTINDRPTTSAATVFTISHQSMILKPGAFVVAAADSSVLRLFPYLQQSDSMTQGLILNHSGGLGLNNDGDAVVLKDLTMQTIDSVEYSLRWHHPDIVDTRGRSLERINPNINANDPRNWSTCTNIVGGTPGKVNTVHTSHAQVSTRISISPNPFSPDGDGFQDFCSIAYHVPLMTSILNVRIYDIKGRLIRTLANGEVAGSQSEIIWDGFDDNTQKARIGVYIVFLEASERSTGRIETAKAVVVVAAKF
jgi:hypothetical protein